MNDDNGFRAYFWVTGFESPDEITSVMGVEPTACWRKGDVIKGSAVRQWEAWTLAVDTGYGSSLEQRLEVLVKRLESLGEGVAVAQQRFRAGINVVAHLVDANPGFHLSQDLIARLSRLRLSVDFDLYCLDETLDPET